MFVCLFVCLKFLGVEGDLLRTDMGQLKSGVALNLQLLQAEKARTLFPYTRRCCQEHSNTFIPMIGETNNHQYKYFPNLVWWPNPPGRFSLPGVFYVFNLYLFLFTSEVFCHIPQLSQILAPDARRKSWLLSPNINPIFISK